MDDIDSKLLTIKDVKDLILKSSFDFALIHRNNNLTVYTILGKELDKEMAIRQFFNSFDEVKNNFLISIQGFLNNYEYDDLCPTIHEKKEMSHAVDPFYISQTYYYLENSIIRLGTLWDILAHICCLLFDVELKDVTKIDQNIFLDDFSGKFKGFSNDEIFSKIKEYFKDNNSFASTNAHSILKNLRNCLIHYIGFSSLKLMNQYMNKSITSSKNIYETDIYIGILPQGFWAACCLKDYFKLLDFTKHYYELAKGSLTLKI